MPCSACNDLGYSYNAHSSRFHEVQFSKLATTAGQGCPSCGIIRDGIAAILGIADYGLVEIDRSILIKEDERHIYPLSVYVEVESENKVQLDFYTDDGELCTKNLYATNFS
jgi:hypothetical protein